MWVDGLGPTNLGHNGHHKTSELLLMRLASLVVLKARDKQLMVQKQHKEKDHKQMNLEIIGRIRKRIFVSEIIEIMLPINM